MLRFGNKEFRNLEEQVQKNKEDIAAHYEVDRVLANFGIKVIGQVDTEEELPAGPFEYGDAYAVGEAEPYQFYIWTRASEGHPEDFWFNVGGLAVVGPQGPQGPQGDKGSTGATGESTKWVVGIQNAPTTFVQPGTLGCNKGDIYLNTRTGDIYNILSVSNQILFVSAGNIKGPQGNPGNPGTPGEQGEQGPQGPQGEAGPTGTAVHIVARVETFDQVPSPTELNDLTAAYLVGATQPYHLYIQVGATVEIANWSDMGEFNPDSVGGWELNNTTLIPIEAVTKVQANNIEVLQSLTTSNITSGTNHRLGLKETNAFYIETTDHDEDFGVYFEDGSRNVSIEMGGDTVMQYDESDGTLEVYKDVETTNKINISTNDEAALIIGDKEYTYWDIGSSYATFKDNSDDVLLEVDSDGWIYTPYVGTNTLSSRDEGRIIVSNTLNMEDDIDMQNDYSIKNVSEITFADGTSMSTAGGGGSIAPLYEHAFMIYTSNLFKCYIRIFKEDDTPLTTNALFADWLYNMTVTYGSKYRLPVATGMYLSGGTILPIFYVQASNATTLTFGYGSTTLQNSTFNTTTATITNYSIRKIY